MINTAATSLSCIANTAGVHFQGRWMISVSNLPVDKTNFSDLPALSDAARFCLQKAQGSQSLKKDNFSKCDFHAKTHVQSEALKLCDFLGVFSAIFVCK